MTVLPFDLISRKSICPRHPDFLLGSHQTADSVSAPREFHPCVVLTQPPPLPATASRRTRYHARTVAGREYHYPHCLSLPHRELPDGYRLLFLAPCSADRGTVSNVAYAHHNNNGNVFDEWVFGCQGTTHSPLCKTENR